MKKIRQIIGKLPIPAWLAGVVTVLFCEILLQLWTVQSPDAGTLALITLFALALGCVLSQALSFIGKYAWGKWTVTGLLGLIAAFYLMEYFVRDFFRVYMSLDTIIAGAGGVAAGFGDVVLDMILKGLWRIVLMLLPVIGYGLFAKPVETQWRTRWILLTAALAAYGLSFGLVRSQPTLHEQMGAKYHFDVAVQRFGLNVGLVLDWVHSGEAEAAGEAFLTEAPPAPETEPARQPAEAEPEAEIVHYGKNASVDFDAIKAAETDYRYAAIHDYVAGQNATSQNAYTGLFAGKNLIFITAEAFSREVLDEKLTPTLYRMANRGIHFTDFYQPKWGASTTGGEFANLTGLLPLDGTCMYEPVEQDMFLLIGKQLQKLGYASAAYHPNDCTFYDRNKTHTSLGYDYFMGYGNGIEEGVVGQWPQSDLEAVNFFLPRHLEDTPFGLYFMSVSGHSLYTKKGNAMGRKNFDKVADLPYSDPVKVYLAANLELEYAMESMVRQLDQAGILEDTVIVISPDHYPYGLEKDSRGNALAELYGFKPENDMDHDHNALIIWSPCLEGKNLSVDAPVCSLDILPTLSNLFGLPFDSRLLVGRDVFSEAMPLALWPDFSWKTQAGFYNGLTGEFSPAEGETVDEDYVNRVKAMVQNKISYSRKVMELNYFDHLSKMLHN